MNIFRLSITASPPDVGRTREPNPQLYKRVKLGDVGYILEGRFHLLFSARKQWESQDLGVKVPATFQPLEFEDIIRGSRRPDRLRARTVLEVGGGVRGSATVGPCVCRF